MITDAAAGQLSTAAAEVYEEFFVPALFGQWVEPMLDAVRPSKGIAFSMSVPVPGWLPVRRSAGGRQRFVVAVDPNEGMLAVAKRLAPDWTCAGVRRSTTDR